MPSFPIIDAHVHLHDPNAIAFPWMESVPKLNALHGLTEFARSIEGAAVEGQVFVEVDAAPGRHLDEARCVEAHGGSDSRLRGIVASMSLERGPAAVEADIAAFAQLPHACGVRRLSERRDEEPGWVLREPFVEAVQLLARHNLPFDLCPRHGQLPKVTALVRRCPEVRFMVDRIAKPGIGAGLRVSWRAQMRELAAKPNVVCKISGVVTEADHALWTYDQVAPYVAHAIDCFGFGRTMFGGDWPVSELATRDRRWVETVDQVTAGTSETDLRKLYRDVAIDFYRL